ncbi:M14 family metallopeptidase [Negadavirga shengliensis]|uniref:M14 family metallopeptidase n=1 Tax=Negadavirga shengliensis TaxID=1389218 RepID=A0ABV9T173_9BACT
MKKTYTILLCSWMGICMAFGQTKSPAEFLGYELGERFTPHHRVVAYFEHVAENNSNVRIHYYGKTNEMRPLMAAFVSSQKNIDQLEAIREDNLKRTGLMEGAITTNVPITWMSYNVHGNEAVSSEATMMTLFSLVDTGAPQTKAWLENNLVVLDPCLNPDGQERYVNWYNQKMNAVLQPDPQSIEHREPWPGGRPNHYLFDLNRDWAWQTQIESQQRVAFYNEWLPQVHLDFHEQSVDQPYYFAPAAEPLHRQLTAYQHEFQELFGRNTARYFDQNNWFYFTKERFDLLYPSYGDTYPMYNGAIGMTIEQGGSGRAGIGIHNAEGDTVTLKDRIIHHHTTALSAIETTSQQAERVLEEFEKYFRESRQNPAGKYKSFVIRGNNKPAKMQALLELLKKNHIRYGHGGKAGTFTGLSYQTGKTERFELAENDIVINAYQPKSVLVQVLFEPEPVLNDSITYDITSWALPYAYNLSAFALESRLDAGSFKTAEFIPNQPAAETLAYIAPWHATRHVAFLAALLRENVRVRFAEYAFEIGATPYPVGSLIITRGGNQYIADFHQKVTHIANQFEIELGQTSTGYVDSGKDFGSPNVKTIKRPKIALVGGEGTSSLNFGEIWHFLDKELAYPVSILEANSLESVKLHEYDLIILPAGRYGAIDEDTHTKMMDWIKAGGKLIAIESALELFADKDGVQLKTYADDAEKKKFEEKFSKTKNAEKTAPYLERERLDISNYAAGAVFEVQMDVTHPLGYGTDGKFYTLKNNAKRFAYLDKGVNAGIIPTKDHHRTGFIGYKILPQMEKSMVFGQENVGRGQIIYMADNPLFRSFWESGKLIMANAIFMAGN